MTPKLNIRLTTSEDIEKVLKIYECARAFMRSYGNTTQWADNYPGFDSLTEDMEQGISYVGIDPDGEIVMTFVLLPGEDPTYRIIYDGEWKNNKPYATIHRIASNGKYPGMLKACVDYCFEKIPNLRSDTHAANTPMRNALKRSGFQECGIIICRNGTTRVAYQKTK